MSAGRKQKLNQAPIVVVAGSDDSEIKRAARQLAGEMAPPEAGDLGCDTIDGAAENVDQAVQRLHQTIDALLTLPFFGGSKLVWLKNATIFSDSVIGRSPSVLEAVEKLTEVLSGGIPEGVRFLLSAIDIDKRRSFYKQLGKIADVQLFDKVDTGRSGWEEAAARAASERARSYGLELRADALELFVLLTGGHSGQVESELEKLDLYLGEERRQITTDDLHRMVASSKASVIFELGNAIASRNLNQALDLIEQLLYQGEKAVGILLVAIIPTVRNLLLVKDLMTRHRIPPPRVPFHFGSAINRLPAQATAHLPRKKDGTLNTYPLGIAAMGARHYEVGELRRALEACLAANVTLVTSGLDAQTVLTELVVRIATPRQPSKH